MASWLCPPQLRPPIVAIYRFARTADDIADEGDAAPDERLADLAAFRADLMAVAAGRTPSPRWPEVFGPLAVQLTQHRLPVTLLADLLDAFAQDAAQTRYADRTELLDYCRRSANPIGRLLLHLYGIDDAGALARSDAICSALQLANFWQDLGVDAARSRLYVPRADASRHGVEIERAARAARQRSCPRPRRRARRLGARADALGRAARRRDRRPRRLGAPLRRPGRPARARKDRSPRRRHLDDPADDRRRRRAAARLARPDDAPRRRDARRTHAGVAPTPIVRETRAGDDSRAVRPAEGRRQRLELLLRLPVPDAAAAGGDHRLLCLLPGSRRRRRRGLGPRRRRHQAGMVAQRSRRRVRRQPEPPGDARADAACRRLRHRAEAPARRHRRLPDGPRAVALPRLPRPRPLLRSRRRRRRRGRGQHLRAHARVDRRLCASPRPGDAAHQHRPRRRRRRTRGTGSTCR